MFFREKKSPSEFPGIDAYVFEGKSDLNGVPPTDEHMRQDFVLHW